MPSGSYVHVENYDYRFDIVVYIRPSLNGNIRGLCGTADGVAQTDFISNGAAQSVGSPTAAFMQSWK